MLNTPPQGISRSQLTSNIAQQPSRFPISPIQFLNLSNATLASSFIILSATISSIGIQSTLRSPFSTRSRIKQQQISIYFERSFKYTFFVSIIAPQLSPSIYISLRFLPTYFRRPRSLKIYIIYQPCFILFTSAIYLDSQLKVTTKRYFLLNQEIGPPQNIITLPNVLFLSTLSPT